MLGAELLSGLMSFVYLFGAFLLASCSATHPANRGDADPVAGKGRTMDGISSRPRVESAPIPDIDPETGMDMRLELEGRPAATEPVKSASKKPVLPPKPE